jgi:hypothetical protein
MTGIEGEPTLNAFVVQQVLGDIDISTIPNNQSRPLVKQNGISLKYDETQT